MSSTYFKVILIVSFTMCAVLIVKTNGTNASDDDDGDDGGGYSFHKFSGPVSGESHPIYVPDAKRADGRRLDYFANPDYSYSYGVKDPLTGNNQEREESRQGDVVQGQYSVLEADGTTRVVKYTADPKNGFQAVVEYH